MNKKAKQPAVTFANKFISQNFLFKKIIFFLFLINN